MLEFPHAILGAAIATKIGNPFLSLPLAFLSHFLLDMIPHWNPHIFTELKKYGAITKRSISFIIIDSAAALFIGSLLAFRFYPDYGRILIIILACFLAVFPDVIEAPFYFFKSKNAILLNIISFQKRIQANNDSIWGFITQGLVVAFCFWIIFT